MNLSELYRDHLSQNPEALYLAVDDAALTYGGLHEAVERNTRILAGLGAQPGDRVALHMDNRVDIAPLYFACFRLGVVATPVSCFDTATEAAYSIEDCGARFLVLEPEMAHKIPDIAAQAPRLERCFVLGGDPENRGPAWETQDDALPTPDPVHLPEDHPAAILYTSGSTGRPKGVTHTHGSLLHNARHRIAALGHGPGDRFLIASKLCHGAGLSSQLTTMALCGGAAIAMRHEEPGHIHEMMRRWKPNFVGTAPSLLRASLNHPTFDPEPYAQLKALYVGGDKAPLDLYDLMREKTGMDLREAMGMTELGGYLNCPPSLQPKPGSAGIPTPGTELRIVDAHGEDVPSGAEGQLIVRTKAMMSGYWGEPEITAAAIKDGWFLTGDLARCDEDGYYFITGRIKDVIIRDTGNVTPAEVEAAMIEHPGVAQCGVFGVPDPEHGEAVAAAIVPADPATPPDIPALHGFATERLAERRVPQHWLIVDSLPLTDMLSKVDRVALKMIGLKLLSETDDDGA